jgi:hypothetical protein
MLRSLWELLFGKTEDYSVGYVMRVENLEAYRSANKDYLHVKVMLLNEDVEPPILEEYDLLMTDKELERMIDRADKNTEDY